MFGKHFKVEKEKNSNVPSARTEIQEIQMDGFQYTGIQVVLISHCPLYVTKNFLFYAKCMFGPSCFINIHIKFKLAHIDNRMHFQLNFFFLVFKCVHFITLKTL